MLDVDVIADAGAAAASLDPVRARLLAELSVPSSASQLASRLDLPRQKVNYHVRALEQHGLVALVEERRKGNCTERVVQARAASFVISPEALHSVAPDPKRSRDRLSARWLLALAGQLVRDLGSLIAGAHAAGKRVATIGMDGEISFRSAADRAAFAAELTTAITGLVSKYHDQSAPEGRRYRLVVAVHPATRPASTAHDKERTKS